VDDDQDLPDAPPAATQKASPDLILKAAIDTVNKK
jgi:hypothetical protein